MAVQYLFVSFTQARKVLADGRSVGQTNTLLMLPGDEYEITLDGAGYEPASHDIALNGTSIDQPLTITFTAAAAVAALTRGFSAGAPAGPSPARAAAKKRAKTAAGAATASKAATKRASPSRPAAKKHA